MTSAAATSGSPTATPSPPVGDQRGAGRRLAQAAYGIAGLIIVVAVVGTVFQALTLYPMPKLLQGLVAIVAGVAGAIALFYFLNVCVESLPQKLSLRLMPYAFVLPAGGLLGALLIYPTIQTIIYSFANQDSTAWVGLDNYQTVLTDPDFLNTITNTLLWVIVVPIVTVVLGLVVAVLTDRLSARWEKVAKAFIFLPMAISFVGAATIWRFVYAYEAAGRTQIGLLNAFWTFLGFDPVAWLQVSAFELNDLLMTVILIWLQVGFAMVLLSAAIKGVPEETLESARIDGAGELQIFRQVIVPQIRGTIVTVLLTVTFLVLKIFDIVYVMTGGNFETNVIAVAFVQQLFTFGNYGIASAIVVILLIMVIPLLWIQVRHFRAEEAAQ